MDYHIHSRKFWLIGISLLLGLLVLSQVSIPRVSAQSPTATINTSAKDVHSAPDFAASKIDIVYQNQVVTLLGRTADSTWVYVNTPNAKTGWMTTTFISSSVPISTLPQVIVTTATPTGTPPTAVPSTATHTAVPPVNATAVVNTGKLNVRSGPGVEFAILTSVNNGQTVGLLARNPASTWALVRTSQAVDGWVNVKYITPNVAISSLPVVGTAVTTTPGPQPPPATATPAGPTAVPGTANVTASTLNVRAAAGLSYARVDQINYGNVVWINGRNLDTSWISLITHNGVAGWVNAKYIASNINFSTLPVTSQTGTGIVLTGRLNVRTTPDPNSTILTSAPQGANMTLLGRTSDNTWLFLRAPDAKEGWSRTDFLGTTTNLNSLPVLAGPVPTSPAPPPGQVPPVYVPPTTGNTAVLRACPNLGCAPTGSVFTGLTITATGRTADSTWVYISTSNGQQGWIPAQFVQLTIPVSSLPVKN